MLRIRSLKVCGCLDELGKNPCVYPEQVNERKHSKNVCKSRIENQAAFRETVSSFPSTQLTWFKSQPSPTTTFRPEGWGWGLGHSSAPLPSPSRGGRQRTQASSCFSGAWLTCFSVEGECVGKGPPSSVTSSVWGPLFVGQSWQPQS